MPKTKNSKTEKNKKITTKAAPKEAEEEMKVLDPDLILGDELLPIEEVDEEEIEDEEGSILSDDEVDPFKDRWEE